MRLEWNLKDLFVDNKAFYQEIDNVKVALIELKNNSKGELNSEKLLTLLDAEWKIKKSINYILVYGSLMYYKDINNEECITLKREAEEFNNTISSELKTVDTVILNYGQEKVLELCRIDDRFKIYEQYLNNLFRMQEHVQNEEINAKIKKNNDLINKEKNNYNELLKNINYGEIEKNDSTITLTATNINKYLAARDRETRKQAFLTFNKSFETIMETLASSLNEVLRYRIENAELEGYNSVLEETLFTENIDSKILTSLIKSVNDNLPLIQEYLKIKATAINIDEPHLYDFNVPLDNGIKRKFTLEEAIDIIKKALAPLGEEYLKTIGILLDGHIDATPSEKKNQSIIFSWQDYSFLNFRGRYADIKNLIHELGHIVNYYLSKKKLPFMYEDSTVFVGETASIVNEILLTQYLIKNSQSDEEKIYYLSLEIENYFTSVFKQTMDTEFEDELYNYCQSEELTAPILADKYFEIIKKYYGEDLIYDKEIETEWTRLGRLWRWSYYSYKYATGLLIASNVVNALTIEHTLTNEKYMEFLEAGSSLYSLDLLNLLNIDLTNSDVINDGFKVLRKDINELKKITKS
ncbi:hypothetical protein EGP98_04065 [bacterium]|nr:hypothetical protein [bacterium]